MTNESGFSLIELTVAVVILAVGLLGFAGSAQYLNRQATVADLRAERALAKADVLERLRTLPFDSLVPGVDSVGLFSVSWDVNAYYSAKTVTLVMSGPGHAPASAGTMPGIVPDLIDTMRYRVPRP